MHTEKDSLDSVEFCKSFTKLWQEKTKKMEYTGKLYDIETYKFQGCKKRNET